MGNQDNLFDDAVSWLENKSERELKDWLRSVFWLRTAHPVVIPSTSRIAIELSEVLRAGSVALRTRVRVCLPELLQEWGRDDPSDTLDDLLFVCGRLRCASAEPAIALIASERLRGRTEETALRQRCLSVLSGFGCSERTMSLFTTYIDNFDYTSICFRALYRYNETYASTYLPVVLQLFRSKNAKKELNIVLHLLFRDLGSASRVLNVLNLLVKRGAPEAIVDAVQTLRESSLLTCDLLLKASHAQRSKFFEHFFMRIPVESISEALWEFKSIGLTLLLLDEQLLGQYETSSQTVEETLFPTAALSLPRLVAFLSGEEPVALSYIEAPEELPS